MLREAGLKILEVLKHGIMSKGFPLGNTLEVRDHHNGDLAFLLMFHLSTDGFKV